MSRQPTSVSRRTALQRIALATTTLAGFSIARAASQPEARTWAEGLDHPWGLAFLPDGRALVTEKRGRLALIDAGGGAVQAWVSGVPQVHARGQGGLLDVAVRTEGSDLIVYLSYAEAGSGDDAGRNGTAVVRARLVGETLHDPQVIFRQTPKAASNGHFGSRLVFDREGLLFVTLGDRQNARERVKAQDLDAHHGKVVRIRPDGSVPGDNPFVNTAGARPEIVELRTPQHPGRGAASGHRRAVGGRARAARRRRTQHRAARSQLRLAAHLLRLRVRLAGGKLRAGGRRHRR